MWRASPGASVFDIFISETVKFSKSATPHTHLPAPQAPFGIPPALVWWAFRTYKLTTERMTHPHCSSMVQGLRPTYVAAHEDGQTVHMTAPWEKDSFTPKDWSQNPSFICIDTQPKTQGKCTRWKQVQRIVAKCKAKRFNLTIVAAMHGNTATVTQLLCKLGMNIYKIATIHAGYMPLALPDVDYDQVEHPQTHARQKSVCSPAP